MNQRCSAALADRELDLLRGTPAVLDVALLAARASAAVIRASSGGQLDDVDSSSLHDLAELLRSAAEVVEFFDSQGKAGAYPSGALSETVDIAVDVLLVDSSSNTDPAAAMQYMLRLAARIAEFATSGDRAIGDELAPTFSHLTQALRARIARTGETTFHL